MVVRRPHGRSRQGMALCETTVGQERTRCRAEVALARPLGPRGASGALLFSLMALLCPDERCAEFSTAQACVASGSVLTHYRNPQLRAQLAASRYTGCDFVGAQHPSIGGSAFG